MARSLIDWLIGCNNKILFSTNCLFYWFVQGAATSISVKVPYTGILDVTAVTFAQCRVEVRDFVKQFVNWPTGNATSLMPTFSGCPAITYSSPRSPYEFSVPTPVCPLRAWIWCLRTDYWCFDPTAVVSSLPRSLLLLLSKSVLCRFSCPELLSDWLQLQQTYSLLLPNFLISAYGRAIVRTVIINSFRGGSRVGVFV